MAGGDRRSSTADTVRLIVHDVRRAPAEDGYHPIALETSRGEIALRYYRAREAKAGAVFVGGVGGGWDSPGRGQLYPQLCEDLRGLGISALRVRFRYPTILEEAALDVLAALHFLETEGVGGAAVTGHSFGGAVALQAGAHSDTVRTVVALSTQAFGAEAAAHLPPGCATLFIHGTADEVLSPECSRYAYKLAHEPKRLRLYEGAGHGLDEIADELRREVRDWIAERLTGRPPP